MEYLQKTIVKLIFTTLVAIFVVIDVQSESLMSLDSVITKERFNAFYALAKGENRWPVWRVEPGLLSIDGKKDESIWDHAQAIYVTGEWMWNKFYKSYPWAYQGLSDFVAVWRLLYDTSFVYVSCEYFDDFHSEGAPSEPWEKTDAVEVLLRHVACGEPQNILMGATGASIRELKVCRKFSIKDSLRATVKIRLASGRDSIVTMTVLDGDPRLGGIFSGAAPFCVAKNRYRGSWFMEFKIPRCAVSGLGLPGIGSFKVGLKVYDDDSLSGTSTNPVLGIGMERYTAWYTSPVDSAIKTYDPLPTFYLAGFRTEPVGFPDETNLYCGKTSRMYYDSTVAFALETCPLSATDYNPLPQSGFALRATPNPFSGGATLTFNVPSGNTPTITLYDPRGARVMVFGSPTGSAFHWSGRDQSGRFVAPGSYILRLSAGGEGVSERITIVR